jgi:predicted component of viral defense system (DUF524 family)
MDINQALDTIKQYTLYEEDDKQIEQIRINIMRYTNSYDKPDHKIYRYMLNEDVKCLDKLLEYNIRAIETIFDEVDVRLVQNAIQFVKDYLQSLYMISQLNN